MMLEQRLLRQLPAVLPERQQVLLGVELEFSERQARQNQQWCMRHLLPILLLGQ